MVSLATVKIAIGIGETAKVREKIVRERVPL